MSSCSSFQCSFEAFEPRQSLWQLVEEILPLEEQREVKAVLGEDIIDEIVDLHREVLVLLEIWQDYRDESEKKSKEVSLKSHYQRLPEPPEMRCNLKKEIQLFVAALRQHSGENGSKIELLSLSKREKNIVDYAFQETGSKNLECTPARPASEISLVSGRSTPCRLSSSVSASRSSSSLSDIVESIQEHLNVQDVDQLAEKLRNILHEEKILLLEDITFLQSSLFEESQFMDNLQADFEEEPSLQELKDLGRKLEKEMTIKGAPSPVDRKSYPSPPQRPYVKSRNVIVRSSSSPSTRTSKPPGLKHRTGTFPSCTRSKRSPPSAQGSVNDSVSESQQQSSVSTLPMTSQSLSLPNSTVSKKTSLVSLSPSPPTSVALRKPGSAWRFRKMVLENRQSES